MTLTELLDELSSLLAECDRMDDALDGIEAAHGAHVLIAQTRDQVLVVRERVAGRVQALFVASGATGLAVMPRPPQTPDRRVLTRCRHCGEAFEPTRPHQQFCQPSCRRAFFTRRPVQRRLPLDPDDLFGCHSSDVATGGPGGIVSGTPAVLKHEPAPLGNRTAVNCRSLASILLPCCQPIGLTGGHTMTAPSKTVRRKRIGKGIYRDRYGVAAAVKVGTGDAAQQREKRFPFDTPLKEIKIWQEAMRGELRTAQRRPVALSRGTLEADATVYLAQVKHLTSYKSRVCEVDAWTALYGRLRRSQITAEHVRKARATWIADHYAPKTVVVEFQQGMTHVGGQPRLGLASPSSAPSSANERHGGRRW